MAARSNALSEITRFWLQARHGCLVDESVPVKVHYGNSDIDLIAIRPDLQAWSLPDGTAVRRAIIETKDEHDFDPGGGEFGKRLAQDVAAMGTALVVPARHKGVKFTMLREEHFEAAKRIIGTDDFDRIFVVHALDERLRTELCPPLTQKRIHWLTVREVVADLYGWYEHHASRSTLRHSFMGDVWHLLVGYCGFRLAEGAQPTGRPAIKP